DDDSVSQSGVVAGTPQYMAPEQARGEPVSPRTDLFSLGAVLYALCTGKPPFRGGPSLSVLRRICEEAPPPVRAANPEAPEWLAAIIDRLLAKAPDDRYPSAAEVAEELQQRLAEVQRAGATTAPTSPARPPGRLRARRGLWAAAGLAALGL